MSELEGASTDPIEVLEGCLEGLTDDAIGRAYIARLGGERPRVSVGPPLALRRDTSVVEQIVAHVQRHAKAGGLFEIKIKGNGEHIASCRLPLELEDVSAKVPPAPRFEEDASPRLVNPSPMAAPSAVDPLDHLLDQARKLRALKEELLAGEGPAPEEDDEEEDDEEDDEEGEKPEEGGAVGKLVSGFAEFVTSESGKMLASRLGMALTERIEAGVELAKATAQLRAAQAVGSIPMGAEATAKPKTPATPAPKDDTTPKDDRGNGPRVVKIHVVPSGGGQAA